MWPTTKFGMITHVVEWHVSRDRARSLFQAAGPSASIFGDFLHTPTLCDTQQSHFAWWSIYRWEDGWPRHWLCRSGQKVSWHRCWRARDVFAAADLLRTVLILVLNLIVWNPTYAYVAVPYPAMMASAHEKVYQCERIYDVVASRGQIAVLASARSPWQREAERPWSGND